MKFKITSWQEKDGIVYMPYVKFYTFWPFYCYVHIDIHGPSKTRASALSRIDDYCRMQKAANQFKFHSEYLIIK